MNFTDQQIWQSSKAVAPKFVLDPHTVMAINEQECEHPSDDVTLYDCSVARLEQGFYSRYTRKFEYSTAVETLLACSWGPMQMMGESLREAKNEAGQNYFEWFFSYASESMQRIYGSPMSPYCVVAALDYYCVTLNIAIEWGCRWFVGKLKSANGELKQALLKWNGGANQLYDDEVLERIPRLKAKFI